LRLGSQELSNNKKVRLILRFITKFVSCWDCDLVEGKAGIFSRRYWSLEKLHENYVTVQISVLFVIILLDVAVAQH
jgi:hypothetical protein